ncbi:MAG: L-serine ammonia-lyase, iron-sulfur-dependent, subunit alpha [Enterocloster bolteae]
MSGIVCDGAKASCAARIASAVDAGILGYQHVYTRSAVLLGDGIVTMGKSRATLKNVGRLGKEGIRRRPMRKS